MPTFRELFAFASGVILTTLLSTLPGGNLPVDARPANRTAELHLRSERPNERPTQPPEPTAIGAEPPAPGSMDAFIDQLENLTVRRLWTSEILGQLKFFRENKGSFENKADFATMSHVMRYYDKAGQCGDGNRSALVLLAGANQGHSTSQVLNACRKARMHIFEIQQKLFENQFKRFLGSQSVTVHRKGWSDTVQQFQITMPRGFHEQAGLFQPVGKFEKAVLLNETVETIPLADFIVQESLERISYVIIDVEGKEPNVIRGMRLESNRANFPVFQYELGGTWTDSRHDVHQWGQYGIAMYLTALGYRLFLMGEKGGQPLLLRLEPEFFRFFSFRPEVDVPGNLLAMHPHYADVGLQDYLQRFVPSIKALPQQCI